LAGFSLLGYFLWRMGRYAWRNRNTLAGSTVFCFVITFMIGSLTNTMVTSVFYLTWLAIIGGIAISFPGKTASAGQRLG
jgi:hypothetical protein